MNNHGYGNSRAIGAMSEMVDFYGLPNRFGFMCSMKLNESTGVFYFAHADSVYRLLYTHDKDKITLYKSDGGHSEYQEHKRDDAPVAVQALNLCRDNDKLLDLVDKISEYRRASQSLSFSKEQLHNLFQVDVSYDGIEFTTNFVNNKRIVAELRKDNVYTEIVLEVNEKTLTADDPVDDNRFIYSYVGPVPSVEEIIKAFSNAHATDFYKVYLNAQAVE